MTPKAKAQSSRFDLVKWLVLVALVVVGVVGNQYYSASPILYRVPALLALAAVAAFCSLQAYKGSYSSKGKQSGHALQDRRNRVDTIANNDYDHPCNKT